MINIQPARHIYGRGYGFIDITGMKFGNLTAIEITRRNPCGTLVWLCHCDCGKEHEVQGSNLRSGRIKSCGCLAGTASSAHCQELRKLNWTGHGKISGSYWSATQQRIKRLAARGITSVLTIEEAWSQFEIQMGRCVYTNLELTFAERFGDWSSQTASLDRINSARGYVSDNIQWVHKIINEMKMDRSHEEFLSLCRLVVDHASKGGRQ